MPAPLRAALTAWLAVIFTAVLLVGEARSQVSPPTVCREASRAACPALDGSEEPLLLRVEGGDFNIGDTFDLNCIATNAGGEAVSESLTLTYVPEPPEQLLSVVLLATDVWGASWKWTEATNSPDGYEVEIAQPPCEEWGRLRDVSTNSVTVPIEVAHCIRVTAYRHRLRDPVSAASEAYIPVPEPRGMLQVGLVALVWIARRRCE